jgi:hypothetical protein
MLPSRLQKNYTFFFVILMLDIRALYEAGSMAHRRKLNVSFYDWKSKSLLCVILSISLFSVMLSDVYNVEAS